MTNSQINYILSSIIEVERCALSTNVFDRISAEFDDYAADLKDLETNVQNTLKLLTIIENSYIQRKIDSVSGLIDDTNNNNVLNLDKENETENILKSFNDNYKTLRDKYDGIVDEKPKEKISDFNNVSDIIATTGYIDTHSKEISDKIASYKLNDLTEIDSFLSANSSDVKDTITSYYGNATSVPENSFGNDRISYDSDDNTFYFIDGNDKKPVNKVNYSYDFSTKIDELSTNVDYLSSTYNSISTYVSQISAKILDISNENELFDISTDRIIDFSKNNVFIKIENSGDLSCTILIDENDKRLYKENLIISSNVDSPTNVNITYMLSTATITRVLNSISANYSKRITS